MVYALKNAKDIQALKAVSQNLMHANLSTTDGVYGVLSGTDVKGEITELGKKSASSESDKIKNLESLVERLLLRLEEGNIN